MVVFAHDGHGHIATRCWRLITALIVAAAARGGGSGHHRVGHALAAACALAHSSPAVCLRVRVRIRSLGVIMDGRPLVFDRSQARLLM